MNHWQNEAPANIALIKYMGKLDEELNIPANSSLSYTLDHLKTRVELELTDGADCWEPLLIDQMLPIQLSQKGQERFLGHFKNLKDFYKVKENFKVRSSNNFPRDCGLASSASSFAALTKTADMAFTDLGYKNESKFHLYQLSRMGSGSSCRSFFSPWAVWKNTEVYSPEFAFKNLQHRLILVDEKSKSISSKEAHKRVLTSLLYEDRKRRAEKRLDQLLQALRNQDWEQCFQITWNEFWDMHVLFETSNPSFRYITEKTFHILTALHNFWSKRGDGPIVTLDAGPNVHLLFREDQLELIKELSQILSLRNLADLSALAGGVE